jgi:protease-4|tara:strand:- start:2546 stop:3415 length:870 start_codon:yes stop_codon:yes gene_type:complete
MGISNPPKESKSPLIKSLIKYVIIGLLVGYFVSNNIISQPSVGIIKISGTIQDESGFFNVVTSDEVNHMLRYAESNNNIKAVVLDINSPGGLASSSEEIYMDVLRLRQKKPVVTSIGAIGASGAYYIAIATDHIYSSPTSIVGSVGVITSLPDPIEIDEKTLTSGPFKETGALNREWVYQSQQVAKSFQQAVINQRGNKLEMSNEELQSARIYIGTVALEKGLIDDIGSVSEAINKAAELAKLKNYQVININQQLNITKNSDVFFVNKTEVIEKTNTAPVNYYLYLEVD